MNETKGEVEWTAAVEMECVANKVVYVPVKLFGVYDEESDEKRAMRIAEEMVLNDPDKYWNEPEDRAERLKFVKAQYAEA